MSDLAVIDMTVFEARECISKIKDGIHSVRALLLDLYERKGWEALGYNSWRSCVVAEFGEAERYLYRQLEAAQAERNLEICPMGQIPERQLRPLASLLPEQQKEVWEKAVETAPEGKVTAKHVENTVIEYKHTETHLVSDAMAYSIMAISQLERIKKDDPLREQALENVIDWCNKKL